MPGHSEKVSLEKNTDVMTHEVKKRWRDRLDSWGLCVSWPSLPMKPEWISCPWVLYKRLVLSSHLLSLKSKEASVTCKNSFKRALIKTTDDEIEVQRGQGTYPKSWQINDRIVIQLFPFFQQRSFYFSFLKNIIQCNRFKIDQNEGFGLLYSIPFVLFFKGFFCSIYFIY